MIVAVYKKIKPKTYHGGTGTRRRATRLSFAGDPQRGIDFAGQIGNAVDKTKNLPRRHGDTENSNSIQVLPQIRGVE
jgi:hypothetical protein